MTAYLNLKLATCKPKTVSSLATRLTHFGRFLTEADPGLDGLDRQRHIEPYLASAAGAAGSRTGTAITPGEQQQRILAARNFLTDITAWGWADAPSRQLIFPGDIPKLPRVLPRYLPVDADRCLDAALRESPYQLAACALLLQRACGLRIGELLDLELDCVHEVPGSGAWLKVPPLTAGVLPLSAAGTAVLATRSAGTSLQQLMYAVNQCYEAGLYFSDYLAFCADAAGRVREGGGVSPPGDPQRIAASGVTFAYPETGDKALSNVSVTIGRGEVVALVGENGSGKTTLAKVLAGLYQPSEGTVTWDDACLSEMDGEQLRERIAVIAQDHANWPLSVHGTGTRDR
jgi:hypothetical protein